jgi:hypothetical protein
MLEMLLDQDKKNAYRKNCRSVVEGFSISKTVSKLEGTYKVAAQSGYK